MLYRKIESLIEEHLKSDSKNVLCFASNQSFCKSPFVELRAPHRGIFPFTRKDTKGVSKGLPLRYPLGEVTVKVGGANQNDVPSP